MAPWLLTGGSGSLGRELSRWRPEIIAPSHDALNVISYPDWLTRVQDLKPAVIIHAAAIASVEICEGNKYIADLINVAGTINAVSAAAAVGARLVFISTEYVFAGRGNYTESDVCKPINNYGRTKMEGERAVLRYDNSLVIRAPFRRSPWPYPTAPVDQFTSGRLVHQVAPDIIRAAAMTVKGILHIGGRRRSMLDLAREATPEVQPGMISDWRLKTGFLIPADTSLDSSRWERICRK